MSETTLSHDEAVAKIVEGINGMLADWESGRLPSPAERDYVLEARNVLGLRGSMPDGAVDFYADLLYEDAGETYVTVEDIARFLVTALTEE